MGSVWEARHASLGTPSAIKFIEAEYADSQEARSRFDKEARAAATIQSKHAIQIYDHGVTADGKPYIVMELLQGEPLDRRLDRVGRLTLAETARILQHVCRGLSRAHERGIVHRDLKPENIFLVKTPEDDDEVAKVLDFGIAKIQNTANPALSSSTKTGAVLGTPFYMSPEQARGLKNVDHRTDVWSLAVIAFKCVTGRLPFDGESVGDLLVKICTAPAPIPTQVAPELPPSFDAWFLRALEREPERRFSSVGELSEALMLAAGISGRSGGSQNPHGGPFFGPSTAIHSPHPAALAPPFIGTPPAVAQGPHPGGTTPAPAMTAAPFTSSQPIPGVPHPGRAKLLFGAALAGLLVAGAGTAVAVAVKKRNEAPPPAPADTVAAQAPSATHDEPTDVHPPDGLPAPRPGSSAPAPLVASAPKVTGTSLKPASTTSILRPTKPTEPKPQLPPLAAPNAGVGPSASRTGDSAVVPPQILPTPPASVAPPAPLPAKKPPNRHDPGY